MHSRSRRHEQCDSTEATCCVPRPKRCIRSSAGLQGWARDFRPGSLQLEQGCHRVQLRMPSPLLPEVRTHGQIACDCGTRNDQGVMNFGAVIHWQVLGAHAEGDRMHTCRRHNPHVLVYAACCSLRGCAHAFPQVVACAATCLARFVLVNSRCSRAQHIYVSHQMRLCSSKFGLEIACVFMWTADQTGTRMPLPCRL